jgi:hypothetical protein
VTLANIVANFELLIPVLLTHVLSKVLKVTTRNVYHLFLTYWFPNAFRFNFRDWALVVYGLLAVEASILLAVFFLGVSMLKLRSVVFFVAVIVCFLQISDVLLVLKVEESRIIVLFKVLLWRLVGLSFLYV